MSEKEPYIEGHVPQHENGSGAAPLGTRSERVVRGIGVAPGVAIGPAYLHAREGLDSVEERELASDEVEEEAKRFERAVTRSENDLKKIISIAREKLGEESADIFEAQLLMLRDEAVYDAVVDRIYREQTNADYAVQTVMTKHRRLMEASDSEYLSDRANDLVDVQERIIRHLRRGKILTSVDPNTIVVAEDLNATDIILFSRRHFLGCVMDYGGATSHVSIMARSLGVPAVVGTHGVTEEVQDGETIILDGLEGRVVLSPTDATLEEYQEKRRQYEERRAEQKELVPLPSKTLDEHEIPLRANIEFEEEVDLMSEYGADGIGLFRTEIPFLMQRHFSFSEEEQYDTYRRVVEQAAPHSTTFRVIDVGGDKILPMARREHNPVLGWRGLRVLLDRREELLLPQLRAILRASAHGPLRILLPMVTSLEEVHQFREVLREAQSQLDEQGLDYDDDVPLGIMVEVPAVALLAERFAAEVDFFSVGTNDLTQYVLAVDRGNDLVADKYDELHPAVLSMIRHVTRAAQKYDIPVSLCGELGGNPHAVPVLIGLGVTELSASPSYLPELKRVVRGIEYSKTEPLARAALQTGDADEVHALVNDWFNNHASDLAPFALRRDGRLQG